MILIQINNFRNNQTLRSDLVAAYSSSLMRAMIKCNRVPFFEIFSNFIHFCQIFEYFALFQHFFALFLENPIHVVNFQNRPCLYFLVNQEFEQTESILGILVNNPHNFEVTEKPVGLGKRENTISRVPGIEKKNKLCQ